MENLFAYGTLMCEDIMAEVSGCRLSHMPGTLSGYSRRPVRKEHYPAIVKEDKGRVRGVIYQNVPESAWDRLDRFEGEMYARRRVQMELTDGATLQAEAYVIQPAYAHLLEACEWNFDDFLRNGKARFMKNYKGYASL